MRRRYKTSGHKGWPLSGRGGLEVEVAGRWLRPWAHSSPGRYPRHGAALNGTVGDGVLTLCRLIVRFCIVSGGPLFNRPQGTVKRQKSPRIVSTRKKSCITAMIAWSLLFLWLINLHQEDKWNLKFIGLMSFVYFMRFYFLWMTINTVCRYYSIHISPNLTIFVTYWLVVGIDLEIRLELIGK